MTRIVTRRRIVLGTVVALVLVAACVAVWFEPQALWLDDEVDEAAPTTEVVVLGGTEAVPEDADGNVLTLVQTS